MKYSFGHLSHIQDFIFRLVQLMADTWTTDFECATKKIGEYIDKWNNTYGQINCLNGDTIKTGNAGVCIHRTEIDCENPAIQYVVNARERNVKFQIIIYYTKTGSKPDYYVTVNDNDALTMFEFNSDVQRNIYSLPFPKTEKEIAYDIYATYCNYVHDESEIYKSQLEAYPKYVEKNFKDSDLLSKILSLLKDKETDKRKILIFIKALL